MAEMHTNWGDDAVFSLKIYLPFYFVLLWSKSFQGYNIFLTPTESLWSYVPPMYYLWTCLLSSMQPMELTRHFCRRLPAFCLLQVTGVYPVMSHTQLTWQFHCGIVLLILENMHTSCYSIHTSPAAH